MDLTVNLDRAFSQFKGHHKSMIERQLMTTPEEVERREGALKAMKETHRALLAEEPSTNRAKGLKNAMSRKANERSPNTKRRLRIYALM